MLTRYGTSLFHPRIGRTAGLLCAVSLRLRGSHFAPHSCACTRNQSSKVLPMNDSVQGLLVRHEHGRAGAPTPPHQAAHYAAYSVEDNAGPSVRSILPILRRRLNLIIGVAIAVCAAGAAFTLMQTPSYSATALLIVNPNPEQIVPEN